MFAHGSGRDLRHGAPDAARLGAPLQCQRAGWPVGPTAAQRPLPRLSAEQQAEIEAWVDAGADLKRDGVVRWRCVDLQQRIEQSFGVCLHERTVSKLLHKLSFRRLSVVLAMTSSDGQCWLCEPSGVWCFSAAMSFSFARGSASRKVCIG